MLKALNPASMRMDILSPAPLPAPSVEPWFQVPYTVTPLAKDLLAKWADPPVLHPSLKMPPPNHFMPTSFSRMGQKGEEGAPPSPPRLLPTEGKVRVWYKADDVFCTPRGSVNLEILAPEANCSAKAAAMTELFIKMLGMGMSETTYLVRKRQTPLFQ